MLLSGSVVIGVCTNPQVCLAGSSTSVHCEKVPGRIGLLHEGNSIRSCAPAMNTILDQDNLGAFCRHTHVAGRGAGVGPLANLIFGVKEIYDVAGHKTGLGCPGWVAAHRAATRSAHTAHGLL